MVFAFGLALMWLMVEQLDVGQLAAAAVSFVVANSIHYALGRSWVYRGTERPVGSGYAFFLLNAGVGLVVTLVGFSLFASFGLDYLLARLVASIFAGISMFVLNATLNFRCL